MSALAMEETGQTTAWGAEGRILRIQASPATRISGPLFLPPDG
jgi:hypothetical protein